MSRRSKYDILNVGYGVLNPEYTGLTGKNYNPDDNSGGFFSSFHKSINLNQQKHSTYNGPMVGICLRNEGRVSQSGWIDPTCWAATSSDIVEEGSKMDLVQIRVRVPELHASKPIPQNLPDKETNDRNHDIINQYPVFVSKFAGVSEPNAGDLVWIDFQDNENKLGGIFLGLAESNAVSRSEGESEEVTKLSGKFKRKPKIRVLSSVGISKDTASRVFITGDSNVVRMTQIYSGGTGARSIDEFASFYKAQAENGNLYENPKGGIGWKGAWERIEYFDDQYSLGSGDLLIIGIGGNESYNSLILQDNKENRDNPKFPGKYGEGSGYSLEYFKDSGVDIKEQKYFDVNTYLNKPINTSSKGWENFINNSSWAKFSKKVSDLNLLGVQVIVFGPPIGGSPWRYINRAYIDQLQKHWFDENGVRYISIIKDSQGLKPNKNDVHYWNNDPSYTKFFQALYAPNLK